MENIKNFKDLQYVRPNFDEVNESIARITDGAKNAKNFAEKYKKLYKEDASSEVGLNYLGMYAFVESMKAAKSVDDVKAIREHMEDGVKNLGDDQKIYDINSIDEDGGFDITIVTGAVEDGKIVPIR